MVSRKLSSSLAVHYTSLAVQFSCSKSFFCICSTGVFRAFLALTLFLRHYQEDMGRQIEEPQGNDEEEQAPQKVAPRG